MGNGEGSAKRGERMENKGEGLWRRRVVARCVPSGKECIAECGKAASRPTEGCVLLLVNCPLDPDDPYLIALLCYTTCVMTAYDDTCFASTLSLIFSLYNQQPYDR